MGQLEASSVIGVNALNELGAVPLPAPEFAAAEEARNRVAPFFEDLGRSSCLAHPMRRSREGHLQNPVVIGRGTRGPQKLARRIVPPEMGLRQRVRLPRSKVGVHDDRGLDYGRTWSW